MHYKKTPCETNVRLEVILERNLMVERYPKLYKNDIVDPSTEGYLLTGYSFILIEYYNTI